MAIYHCHVQVIGRSKGRSAVGASAYRSGTKMTNEHDGLTHDYTNKTGIVHSEVMLPENAKDEWQDRESLWNAVEKIEKGNRAQLAREFDFALPNELNLEEQINLTRNFVGINFVTDGMCADIAIHDKGDGNPHAHVMLTMRPIDQEGEWEHKSEKVYLFKNREGEEKGFTARELKELPDPESWQKQLPYYKNGNSKLKPVYLTEYERANKSEYRLYERVKGKNDPKKDRIDRLNPMMEKWNSKEYLMNYREALSDQINLSLKENEINEKVDHRSFQEQGKDNLPTKHLGVSASQMEKRGAETSRGRVNREIQSSNKELHELDSQTRILKQQHNFIKLDIQTQTVHDYLQRMKGEIQQSDGKQFGNIEQSINQLDDYIEKFRSSEAGKSAFVEIGEEKYPFKEYHLKKLDNGLIALRNVFQERKESLAKPIGKTSIKDKMKAATERSKEIASQKKEPTPLNPGIEEIAKELYNSEKEYRDILSRIDKGDRETTGIYLKDEYLDKIKNIKYWVDSVSEDELLIEATKKQKCELEKDIFGGFFKGKGKEKDTLQASITRMSERRENSLVNLNALGVNNLSEAPTVIDKLNKLSDERNKSIKEFNQGRKVLQTKLMEIKAAADERYMGMSPEEQKLVKEKIIEYRQSDRTDREKGKMSLKMSIDEIKAEQKAIKDLEPADTTQQIKPKGRDFDLDR